jgi:hypothetical protein
MSTPAEVLERLYVQATQNPVTPTVQDPAILARIDYVSRCLSNRAGARLIMACMLAKIEQPHVDPRQPYTEIGGDQCFSGRTYDERYLPAFINAYKLPCNPTTGFLTPALRNMNRPLTTGIEIVGRPARLYRDTIIRGFDPSRRKPNSGCSGRQRAFSPSRCGPRWPRPASSSRG